jgi:hypothetical protein
VQQLVLDFDLGIMELDSQGVRIPHDQPIRSFLADLPCTVPFELPDACDGACNVTPSVQEEALPAPADLNTDGKSYAFPIESPTEPQPIPPTPNPSPQPVLLQPPASP